MWVNALGLLMVFMGAFLLTLNYEEPDEFYLRLCKPLWCKVLNIAGGVLLSIGFVLMMNEGWIV